MAVVEKITTAAAVVRRDLIIGLKPQKFVLGPQTDLMPPKFQTHATKGLAPA